MEDTLQALAITFLSIFVWLVIAVGLFHVFSLSSIVLGSVICALWLMFGLAYTILGIDSLIEQHA